MNKMDLFDLEFLNESRIKNAMKKLNQVFLINYSDISDISERKIIKDSFLRNHIIIRGLVFDDNTELFKFPEEEFEKRLITFKKELIEHLCYELMDNYIDDKYFNNMGEINRETIKAYISNYTTKIMVLFFEFNKRENKEIEFKTALDRYTDLNESNDLYLNQKTIKEIEEEAQKLKDEKERNEEIELNKIDAMKEKRKKAIENHYYRIQNNLKINYLNKNDVFFNKNIKINNKFRNIHMYLIEYYDGYKYYEKNWNIKRNIEFIKNIEKANLEVFDLLFLDNFCNISITFELSKFAYENNIKEESEYIDFIRNFSEFSRLPIFDMEFLHGFLDEYIKLEDKRERDQFQEKMRKIIYHISYFIIPLYNAILPSVILGILKIDQDFKSIIQYTLDQYSKEVKRELRTELKKELEKRYTKKYVNWGEKIIKIASSKIDRTRQDTSDQSKEINFAQFITNKFEYTNKILTENYNSENSANINLVKWINNFDSNISKVIKDKKEYQILLRKFIDNILDSMCR